MARQEFTTYINALMDASAQRNFDALDQMADKSFGNIRKSADQALSAVDQRIGRFRNSFEEVSRSLSRLTSGGLQTNGGLDLGVTELRQAAAESRLYEEALRTTLRTATMLKLETGDNTRETRDYINALQASLNAAQSVTRGAEDQVRVFERMQEAIDGTASRMSLLSQRQREYYAEQAKAAQGEVYARNFQSGINATRGIDAPRAVDNGAGFSAIADQMERQDRLVTELNAGVATLERQFSQAEKAIAAETQRATLALEQQSQELRRLAEAEAGAARGSDMMAAILRGTALETGRAAKSAQDMVAAYAELDSLTAAANRVRGAMDPLGAAQQRLNAELQQFERFAQAGVISTRELGQMQDFARKKYEQTAQEIRDAAQAVHGYGNSMRGQRTAMIQSGQQLQDIAISFAGGQRASTIFAQQLPQLAYALQDVGGRAGKVATFFSGPWGLALVGASLLLGGLIDKLFGTSDAADKAREKNIDFTNSLETSRAFVLDYANAIDQLTNATRGLINTQAILVDSLAATGRATVADLNSQLSNIDAQISKLQNQRNLPGSFNTSQVDLARLKSERATVVAQMEQAKNSLATAETALEERQAHEAANSDTRIRGEIDRERARLRQLRERTKQMGAVPLAGEATISEAEFKRQTAALDKREKDLADSIKERGRAESRARSDARAAARQAEQEAEALARRNLENKKLQEEIALEAERGTMTQGQYEQKLVDINRRYSEGLLLIESTNKAGDRGLKIQLDLDRAANERVKSNREAVARILDGYSEMETAQRRAAKDRRTLDEMVGKPYAMGGGLFTQEMADDAKAAIEEGLQRPYRAFLDEMAQGATLASLQAQGLDTVAEALERALQLQQQGATIGEDEFQTILEKVRAQESLNDRLETARQINGDILNIANDTRQSMNDALVGIARGKGLKALKDFGNSILDNVLRQQANQLTAKLFSGANDKLRGLLDDSQGVRQAIQTLEDNAKKTGETVSTFESSTDRAGSAAGRLADALEGAAGRVTAASAGGLPSSPLAAPDIGGAITEGLTNVVTGSGGFFDKFIEAAPDLPAGVLPGSKEALDIVSRTMMPPLGVANALGSINSGDWGLPSGPMPNTDVGAEIVVNGRRTAEAFGKASGQTIAKESGLSTGKGFSATFGEFGGKLDEFFGTGKVFKSVGEGVGKAFAGAGEGMAASGFAGMLGVKQNSTGAAIGGAIGSFIPGVGGAIGGLIGGTLGGLLFKPKPKYGTARIGMNEFGEIVGTSGGSNDSASKAAAMASAGAVGDILMSMQDQLGLKFDEMAKVTIGKFDGKWRVNTEGRGGKMDFKGNSAKGLVNFGEDGEQEAVEFAVKTLLEKSVVSGISKASINILKSGQDLQRALQKATVIESIPKRLMAIKDPVRAAITELNDEFGDMIDYLKEGKATAQQFAEAQELYDLERAEAIEQATKQASSALRDFMEEMQAGGSSPLSRRTVYNNALSTFSGLEAKVAAGEAVSQDDLLKAAQNFQDASRALNGSSSDFFADFDRIFNVLDVAADRIEGATGTSTGSLPASPFADPELTKAIADIQAQQLDATKDQTAQIVAQLSGVQKILHEKLGVVDAAKLAANGSFSLLPTWSGSLAK